MAVHLLPKQGARVRFSYLAPLPKRSMGKVESRVRRQGARAEACLGHVPQAHPKDILCTRTIRRAGLAHGKPFLVLSYKASGDNHPELVEGSKQSFSI